MKLRELKEKLGEIDNVSIYGIEPHFHITEVGIVKKAFIDCGGVVRTDTYASMQVWVADDKEHRITPEKFLSIITLAESRLNGVLTDDLEVRVEHQGDTINISSIEWGPYERFHLNPLHTDCLAKELCLPANSELIEDTCCGGGCCV